MRPLLCPARAVGRRPRQHRGSPHVRVGYRDAADSPQPARIQERSHRASAPARPRAAELAHLVVRSATPAVPRSRRGRHSRSGDYCPVGTCRAGGGTSGRGICRLPWPPGSADAPHEGCAIPLGRAIDDRRPGRRRWSLHRRARRHLGNRGLSAGLGGRAEAGRSSLGRNRHPRALDERLMVTYTRLLRDAPAAGVGPYVLSRRGPHLRLVLIVGIRQGVGSQAACRANRCGRPSIAPRRRGTMGRRAGAGARRLPPRGDGA